VKNRNLRIQEPHPIPPPFFNIQRHGEFPMDHSSLFGRLFFEINSMSNFGLFSRDDDEEDEEDDDYDSGSHLFDNFIIPRFRVTQPRTIPQIPTPRISPNSQGGSLENPIVFDAPTPPPVHTIRPINVQNDGVVHILDEDDDDVLEIASDGTIVIN
jgi:hypothetical protein